MKLEELVPPLELCKLIPEGEFEDSALVWIEAEIPQENKKEWNIVNRTRPILACHNPKHPAPTLQEIMAELKRDYSKVGVSIRYDWCCYIVDEFGNDMTESDNSEAVVSALKLWLKLKGIIAQKQENFEQ